MAACERAEGCAFHDTVEPSVVKRVKYATAYMYCRGGRHETCAIYTHLAAGRPVPRNLMPDGKTGDYADDVRDNTARRFMVIEDSPVFAALAANTISTHFSGAEVVRHPTFDAAARDLQAKPHSAIVCGFGLGDGRTAHDVRTLTDAPMVILTGRPNGVDAPRNAQVVQKSAGSEALAAALRECLV